MAKGLHKLFKAVVNELNNSLPDLGNWAQKCHNSFQNPIILHNSQYYQQM